jgi:hypothetical protein
LKRPLVSQPSSTASTMWRSSPAPITLPAAGMAVMPARKAAADPPLMRITFDEVEDLFS